MPIFTILHLIYYINHILTIYWLYYFPSLSPFTLHFYFLFFIYFCLCILMDFFKKLSEPQQSLIADLTGIRPENTDFLYNATIRTFYALLFILGANSQVICPLVALSFIIPLQSLSITNILIESKQKDNLMAPYLIITLSFMQSNTFLYILLFSSIFYSLFNYKLPLPIEIKIILIYYFRTVYTYSELPNLSVTNFICILIYFSIGCCIVISRRVRFMSSALFYSFLSSVGLFINVHRGHFSIIAVLSMGILSFLIQNGLFYFISKQVKNRSEK